MTLQEKKILGKYQFWRDVWGKGLSADFSKILCDPCGGRPCGCETGCRCDVGCELLLFLSLFSN